MDPAVIIFVGVPTLLAIILGPLFGAEDRPAFKWPDRKPRSIVGPPPPR